MSELKHRGGFEPQLEAKVRSIIVSRLRDVLPVPVRVSFGAGTDDELGTYASINVFWPKYVLSWVGRPEQHKYRAKELVERSLNRNWLSRFVGKLTLPYVQNYISSYPEVIMPKTDVEYPEGRLRLRVLEDASGGYDTEYVVNLVEMWADEIRRTALYERGAQEI